MIRTVFITLLVVMISVFACSCGMKEDKTPAPSTSSEKVEAAQKKEEEKKMKEAEEKAKAEAEAAAAAQAAEAAAAAAAEEEAKQQAAWEAYQEQMWQQEQEYRSNIDNGSGNSQSYGGNDAGCVGDDALFN